MGIVLRGMERSHVMVRVGLTIAADLLQRIVLFIPNLIAAIFILLAGMFVAVILKNVVKTAGSNAAAVATLKHFDFVPSVTVAWTAMRRRRSGALQHAQSSTCMAL